MSCINHNLNLPVVKLVLTIISILILSSVSSFSLELSYLEKYLWLRETFEENDAGFQYVIDRKGVGEYEKHNLLIEGKLAEAETLQEAVDIYREWLRFFRNGHLFLNINRNVYQNTEKFQEETEIDEWEEYRINNDEFSEYLNGLEEPGFEGIWISEPYTIGIKKVANDYIGFILDAEGTSWQKSQIKLRIMPTEEESRYESVWYMGDYSPRFFDDAQIIGNDYLCMGWINLQRILPEYQTDEGLRVHFEIMKTNKPLIRELNNDTILLRIPSFAVSEKTAIDSLIFSYHDKISNTEKLIIDIRNNSGGSDSSFEKILPYLYTNPIRTIGLEFLSTPLNNSRMTTLLNLPEIPEETKIWIRETLEILDESIGEFINLHDDVIQLYEQDNIFEYPQKVAIIINEMNASTAEQFLLSAKQSQKVKLYGRTTSGVLDVSNMHTVNSPCEELVLGYALSKSLRLPDMPIDDIGIQPDFYIDRTIPGHKWLEHVQNILEWN